MSSNDDNNSSGFWSRLGSALEKLAILYLVLCLFDWFMRWSFQSKAKCWVFWSVLCTVGSFMFLGIGIVFVSELIYEIPSTHPWYLTTLFLASAISGMVWAAILVETKLKGDFPGDRRSLAACCIIGIALLVPSTVFLGKWFDRIEAEKLKEGYTLLEPPPSLPHSYVWLYFEKPVTDDLRVANNFTVTKSGKTIRVFGVHYGGESVVELETENIQPWEANAVNVDLSSNLAARVGMAKAELR